MKGRRTTTLPLLSSNHITRACERLCGLLSSRIVCSLEFGVLLVVCKCVTNSSPNKTCRRHLNLLFHLRSTFYRRRPKSRNKMGSCMSSLSADQPRNHNLTKWCNIMLNKNKKRRRSRNGSKSKSKRGLFSRFGVSTDLSKVQSGVAVSDGCYDENLLHRLSDRLFLNGASENACLFTQQGRKGTNQDAMLVWEVPF